MNQSHYFKFGLFVLIAIGLLFLGIVAFGSGTYFKQTVSAETYFEEPVSGLDAGSVVRYRGVAVGTVKEIRLVATRYAGVEEPSNELGRMILVSISLNKDILPNFDEVELRRAVADGLRAQLVTSILTGTSYLDLNFFDPKKYPPLRLAWKPEGVYIPSVPSTTAMVMTSVEKLTAQLQEMDLPGIGRRVSKVLDTANRSMEELNIPEVREQMLSSMREIRDSSARIKQLLNDPGVTTAMQDLPKIANHLQSSLARVDELVHDKRVDQTITALSETANSVGPAAVEAKKLLTDMRALLLTQQEDIRSIVTELQSTAANLNALSEDLKSNPSRLLFGQPPIHRKPGE